MSNESLHWVWIWVTAGFQIAAIIAGLYSLHYGKLAEKEKAMAIATEGTLSTPNTNSIVTYPKIRIGNNGITMRFGPNGGSLGSVLMFDDLKDDHLRISVKDGKMRVSTVIRDESGHLIASIIENEWKTSPAFSFDRNYSDRALEVIDFKGKVVLQIQLNGDVAEIQGIFCSLKGSGVAVYAKENGAGIVVGFNNLEEVYDKIDIKPLFKYPSGKFFGVLADPVKGK